MAIDKIVEKSVAVVGYHETVLLFKTLGFKTFPTETKEETEKVLKQLIKKKFLIFFITEDAAKKVPELIGKYQFEVFPCFVTIPSNKGMSELGMDAIRINVEKAIGTNILNDD